MVDGKYPKWNEASPALGGAWLKASTWPPDYDDKLDVLLIRDGTVVEVVSSTVGRFCRGAYKKRTAAFEPFLRSWPGWGVQIGPFSVKGIFDSELKIGDAVVLWIAPLEYEGKLVG